MKHLQVIFSITSFLFVLNSCQSDEQHIENHTKLSETEYSLVNETAQQKDLISYALNKEPRKRLKAQANPRNAVRFPAPESQFCPDARQL